MDADVELEQLFESERQARHQFDRMKRRYDSAVLAARDTWFPADRNARLRAEKEMKVALNNLIEAARQSTECLLGRIRSLKSSAASRRKPRHSRESGNPVR